MNSPAMLSPHIIAAAPFEAQPLMQALAEHGIKATLHVCGIGAINAAQSASALAANCAGQDCIYVGSAGSFTPFSEIRIHRALTVEWADQAQRNQASYAVPESMPLHNITPKTWPPLASFPGINVVGSATISCVGPTPHELSAYNNYCETLELYSLCGPLLKTTRSFTAILALTNQVGPQAHAQWLAHHQEAALRTARALIDALNP